MVLNKTYGNGKMQWMKVNEMQGVLKLYGEIKGRYKDDQQWKREAQERSGRSA